MAKKVRTFLAVDLSARVRTGLKAAAAELKPYGSDVRWVAPEHLHITLEFLGDVPIETVSSICRAVQGAVRRLEPFSITVAGLGGFPNRERPHTLWAGVSDGAEQLVALQAVVVKSLDGLPVRTENRRFSPHVTIGRLTRGAEGAEELGEALEERGEVVIGSCPIREVLVLGSTLSALGPAYHVQGRATLEGQASAPQQPA